MKAWTYQALLLTVRLAAVTTAILLPVALVLSAWLARSRSWVAHVVEAGVGLPLVLPPTVLGFYLLVLMGPATAPGRLLVRSPGTAGVHFLGAGDRLDPLQPALRRAAGAAGFRGIDAALLEARTCWAPRAGAF